MVKEIASAPRAELQKRQVLTIELYEFTLDGEVHRWTTNNEDVSYSGNIFKAWGMNLSRTPISVDLEGALSDITITAANVDGILGRKILAYELLGASLILKKAFSNCLSTGEAWIVFQGTVDEIQLDENVVTVKARPYSFDLQRSLPRRFYGRYCPWRFKAVECGYSGSAVECGKTLSDCIAHSNVERFGGFDLYVTPV